MIAVPPTAILIEIRVGPKSSHMTRLFDRWLLRTTLKCVALVMWMVESRAQPLSRGHDVTSELRINNTSHPSAEKLVLHFIAVTGGKELSVPLS